MAVSSHVLEIWPVKDLKMAWKWPFSEFRLHSTNYQIISSNNSLSAIRGLLAPLIPEGLPYSLTDCDFWFSLLLIKYVLTKLSDTAFLANFTDAANFDKTYLTNNSENQKSQSVKL